MILNQYIRQIQAAAPDFDLSALDVSKNPDFDLALPLFKLAALTKQKPAEIFLAIEQKITNLDIIHELVFLNGFLNIKLNQDKFKADLFKVLIKNYKKCKFSSFSAKQAQVLYWLLKSECC